MQKQMEKWGKVGDFPAGKCSAPKNCIFVATFVFISKIKKMMMAINGWFEIQTNEFF
jgi:hypothetical protein